MLVNTQRRNTCKDITLRHGKFLVSSPVNLLLQGNSVLGINRSLGITKEMSAETRFKAVISNHCMSLTKKRIILSCFRKWKSRERIKSASIENYEQERRKKEKKTEVVRESPTESKLRANGCNNSQHCWPNNVGRCCVRLHVAKSSTGFKLWTTTPNNAQQYATGRAKWSNM